ncbi:hypothetical protein N658DRAFT_497284, partial [Parathielavia hyrcaniae]
MVLINNVLVLLSGLAMSVAALPSGPAETSLEERQAQGFASSCECLRWWNRHPDSICQEVADCRFCCENTARKENVNLLADMLTVCPLGCVPGLRGLHEIGCPAPPRYLSYTCEGPAA